MCVSDWAALDVPGCDCQTVDMADYTPIELARIAEAVTRERVNRSWGKEAAGRRAGINSITWKKVEDQKPVLDTSYRAIEKALEWGAGSIDSIAQGTGPHPEGAIGDDSTNTIRVGAIPLTGAVETRESVSEILAEGTRSFADLVPATYELLAGLELQADERELLESERRRMDQAQQMLEPRIDVPEIATIYMNESSKFLKVMKDLMERIIRRRTVIPPLTELERDPDAGPLA